MSFNLAIFGATGLVGETMRSILEERNLPINNIYFFASERSAGKKIKFLDKEYEIIELSEENLKKFQKELEEIEKKSGIEVTKLEDEENKIKIQREILTKDMNPKILSFYDKIRKWAKNTAVVPVKKQACYGCFMKLNDKTYNLVIRSDDIVTCPHCGRILYKEIEDVKQ